ncbi:ABC transporter permease [Williamsia sterculiae]|uniref:ABC-2 family transporter protein n=1 Tax=Williamsia sterculiae TaxID=1344003 RepID=A0A1N7H8Z0_9NOCA|nr:ABC transporter permease subunit [Williamsia sterculiae]SIS21253.1 ABC-2 family transporter protein [Williamsia sterculiae]
MTTVIDTHTDQSAPARVDTGLAGMKIGFLGILRSEWTKLWSLRSTYLTLATAVVLMIGIGTMVSAVNAGDIRGLDPIYLSLAGVSFAQLAIGVLGVLLVSGEYSTGSIRTSLTAVPSRLPVLAAKITVFAGVVFAVSLPTAVVSFLIGQSVLGDAGVSLSADGALRSVFGAAAYVTLAGVIGVAFGALLRNTAGAVATFVAIFFLLSPVTQLLPGSVKSSIDPYLPSNAGGVLYNSVVTNGLSPLAGFALLFVYTIAAVTGAAILLRRRDV